MMTMTWIARVTLVISALLAFGTIPVAAQRPPGGGRPQNREEMESRFRAQFAKAMKQRLGLTDEQAAQMETAVGGFQADRMALRHEEMALRLRVEAIFKDENASDEEARDVLQRLAALRLNEARLFESEQKKLLEILSPTQVVRFHAMREQMGGRIQQMRGGGPPGTSPHPGGGPPRF